MLESEIIRERERERQRERKRAKDRPHSTTIHRQKGKFSLWKYMLIIYNVSNFKAMR